MTNKTLSFTWLIRSLTVIFWVVSIFFFIFWVSNPKEKKHKNNTLNIFAWSGIIHPSILKDFQDKYHIKVNVDYFSSNEELLLKIKATKGQGYDLIIESDYATQILIKENLLKPLNKNRLDFLSDIDPFLIGHPFDPSNEFSIPIEWDICGFGIDTDLFDPAKETLSWKHLFNEADISHRIAMTNDPVEVFCLASYYLYQKTTNLTPAEALEVTRLLKNQKKWVEAYAIPRSDYLLASKNASLAVVLNGFVMQAKQDFPNIKFITPQDASFISIESVSLTSATTKDDLIYQFLNFLYKKENLVKCSDSYGFFPASISAEKAFLFHEECEEIKKVITEKNYQLFFFRHLLPEEALRNLWIQVKS